MTITPNITSLLFSSQLPDVTVSTPADQVTFKVYGGGEELYSTDIYTFGGNVSVYDIREIIEEAMLARGLSFMQVILKASPTDPDEDNEASASFGVVYCSQYTTESAGQWLRQRFLSTASAHRAYPGGRHLVSLFRSAGEADPAKYGIIVRHDNGQCHVISYQASLGAATADQVLTLAVGWNEISDILETENVEGELIGWTVSVGDRSASYYIDYADADESLLFRNCFNAWEAAAFACSTDKVSSLERSEAIIGGKSVWYDCRSKASCKVATAPLTREEAEWLAQLVTSHEVRIDDGATPLAGFDALQEILIEQSEISVTDNPESVNSVSYTWRLADNRNLLPQSGKAVGVFTDKFNISFN